MSDAKQFYETIARENIAREAERHGRAARSYEEGPTTGNDYFDDLMGKANPLTSTHAIREALDAVFTRSAFHLAYETAVAREIRTLEQQLEKRGFPPLSAVERAAFEKHARDSFTKGFTRSSSENPDDPDEHLPEEIEALIGASSSTKDLFDSTTINFDLSPASLGLDEKDQAISAVEFVGKTDLTVDPFDYFNLEKDAIGIDLDRDAFTNPATPQSVNWGNETDPTPSNPGSGNGYETGFETSPEAQPSSRPGSQGPTTGPYGGNGMEGSPEVAANKDNSPNSGDNENSGSGGSYCQIWCPSAPHAAA